MGTNIQIQTIKYSTLLFLFILLPFFIDQIQGYLKIETSFEFPFSALMKAAMIILMFFYLCRKKRISELLFLVFLTFILLLSVLTDSGNLHHLPEDIAQLAKLIFFPVSFIFFSTIFRHQFYSDHFIYEIFRFLFYALFIAIVASVFGFGASQYGVDNTGAFIGYSGYFWAGNELSLVVIIIYSYNLFYNLYYQSSFIRILWVFFIGFITCLLISTKVAIGGFLLVTLLLPVFMNLNQSLLKLSQYFLRYYSYLVVAGMAIIWGVVYVLFDLISAYYNRLAFFYDKADSIANFLSSGRDRRVVDAIDIYVHQYSPLQQIFGGGVYYTGILSTSVEKLTVEIDPLDMLLAYGILGFLLIYLFWFGVTIYLAVKTFKTKDRYIGISLFLMLFCLAVSATSGHVLLSTLTSFYLSIIAAHAFQRNC